jgi:hypothetical protein
MRCSVLKDNRRSSINFHDGGITVNFNWPVFFNGIERVAPDVASHNSSVKMAFTLIKLQGTRVLSWLTSISASQF